MSLNIDIKAHLAENPLDKTLRKFRGLYSIYFITPCENVFGNPKNINECRDPLEILINLFMVFIKVSFNSSTDIKKLQSRLETISSWMEATSFDLTPFEPIVKLILNHATDIEIWNSLMQLIDELETIMSATDDQLDDLATKSIYRRVVETHNGTQMNMEDLKEALSGELEGSVFVNVIGFWDKYFESERMKVERDILTKKYAELCADPKFKFPAVPTEDAVWKWMKVIENDLFQASRDPKDLAVTDSIERYGHAFTGSQFHTLAAGQIIGNQAKRQVDYFIKRRDLPIENEHHWSDILVVGELTISSSKVFRQKFLQLSVYMREVFMAQPLRRFVHGFILFERDLQLWVYDRSGPYSCSYIDIGKSPEKLVHVLVTYMLINDEELGLEPNVKYNDNGMVVHLKVPGSGEPRMITLDPKPISQQKAYLCRGTSCYVATNSSCVVKFSWRICDSISEIELLEKADSIAGMVRIIGSLDLVKISQLREGLIFTKTMVKNLCPTENVMNTPHDYSGEIKRIPKESVNNQLGRKRKSEALQAEKEVASSSKREKSVQESTKTSQRVTGSRPLLSSARFNHGQICSTPTESRVFMEESSTLLVNQSISEKRKTVDDAQVNNRMKRIQLSSNVGLIATDHSAGSSRHPGTSTISKSGKKSAKMVNAEVINPRDRQFTAAGISPYGRPIDKFRSVLELVIGMNDAIKAHRSLLMNAKILHRDISVNNILLTGMEKADKLGGVLIDLDLATLLEEGKGQDEARLMTGTMQFIALDILRNSFAETGTVVTHTYRHDLESFLYVLLWVCINCGWKDDDKPHGDFLSRWYIGSAQQIYDSKENDMRKSRIRDLISKFAPRFFDIKDLAEEFWDVLFVLQKDKQKKKSEDPHRLYGPIIAAFDRAIQKLKV
ncbi:BgTH12-01390 [Blumeria graminis f. sp. triticale]|uniref:non-specific serine/threonine protein kinase n=1 Tax=Blumeria graminis f. sp. triticale TaxID=1689686 RepID=A0A9W4CZ32_BLUGR|nr:BgTH12-01390 [Blumeria graminis f. sp. triticale]